MKKFIYLIFLLSVICVFANEENYIERINSHMLIEDYSSALQEVQNGYEKLINPSIKLKLKYIECLALNGYEIESIKELKRLKNQNANVINSDFLENLCWAILNKASTSSQYMIRLTSLIGAHLTQDVRAVNLLNRHMFDNNAVIRSIAIQFASSYLDKPLKDTMIKLFEEEKLWLVRLEVIKAIGKMKLLEKTNNLKEIIASDKSTYEEKEMATNALVSLLDDINLEEIKSLAKSLKSGLRKLACDLSAYFNVIEAKELIIDLVDDPIMDVRISALNAISLNYLKDIDEKVLNKILIKATNDICPSVAITAAYIALLKDFDFGRMVLKKYLFCEDFENARFASCVLAHLPNKAFELKKEVLKNQSDIFVKANLALGLLLEKRLIKQASDILFDFLKNEKEKLMWEERINPLFQVLSPSHIRHIDQIPRYPEGIDQITRLHILTALAIIEDPRACDGIKEFLKQKGWGITGFASATLLKESDEDALSIIKGLLNEDDQNIKVQAALVLALLGKDETVISTLEQAYEKADYNMKIQILEALGHIASKKSIDFLINILDEPYQNLRVVAASTLVRCINS